MVLNAYVSKQRKENFQNFWRILKSFKILIRLFKLISKLLKFISKLWSNKCEKKLKSF